MFKKPRRVARKVGRDDDERQEDQEDEASVVKRPLAQSKLAKAKKAHRASVRPSFGGDTVDESPSAIVDQDAFASLERKKTAAQSNRASLASSRLPYRSPDSDEKPSYSADYIASLKSEQQTAPPSYTTSELDADAERGLATTRPATNLRDDYIVTDVSRADTGRSAIPSDAEIREKKERRRRLALEQKADDYIALDDDGGARGSASSSDADDDDPRKHSLIIPAEERGAKPKHNESRLGAAAVDDDDFAEGFDSFVDDPGRVALGRRALRAQDAARRAEISTQIRLAEGGADDGSDGDGDVDGDADERARLRAYEAAQTRHGTYGERHTAVNHRAAEGARGREERWRGIVEREYRPRPAADLKSAVARFKAMVEAQRVERAAAEESLRGVQKEREEILTEEKRVQQLVREAGERLERLTSGKEGGAMAVDDEGPKAPLERPPSGKAEKLGDENGADDEDENDDNAGAGLGFGRSNDGMQAGLGASVNLEDRQTSFAGMGRPPSPEW